MVIITITIFKLLNCFYVSPRISSPSHQGRGRGARQQLSGSLLPAVVKLQQNCIGHWWLCLTVEFIRGPVAASIELSVSLLPGLRFCFGVSLATRITLTLKFVALFYELCLTEMHSPQPTATAY